MGTLTGELHLDEDQRVEVDYTTSFRNDVLCLGEGRTEGEWENDLLAQAEEVGVDLHSPSPSPPPPAAASNRQSTLTGSSRLSRRSASMYSSASQSTDLTSNFSDASRDIYVTKRKRQSGASLSLHDYDIFLARGTTDELRTVISFSPASAPADSALSLPLYSPPRRPSRVLKGLSKLRFHRLDQSWPAIEGCPHCPRNPLIQRRAMHKLPCGHRLCTQALRSTIKTALESKADAVPSCCGYPISGKLVQHVMTYEEQESLLHKLAQWDDTVSLASSLPRESAERPTSLRPHTSPQEAPCITETVPTEIVHDERNEIHSREDFKQLNEEQSGLRDRFLAWETTERSRLHDIHQRHRWKIEMLHERLEEEKIDSNARAMVEAEDRQVKAEADLRATHDQEKRDNATALKHLEAYCAGEYSSGEAHNRIVTDQGRAELAKAKRIRDTMDSKHESAINVLRGEQARRITLRQQRQNRELHELRRSQRMEQLSFERACTAELQAFEAYLAEKQAKLTRRWALQNTIFAKKLELELGIVIGAGIPPLHWPEQREHVPRASGAVLDGERMFLSTRSSKDSSNVSTGLRTALLMDGPNEGFGKV